MQSDNNEECQYLTTINSESFDPVTDYDLFYDKKNSWAWGHCFLWFFACQQFPHSLSQAYAKKGENYYYIIADVIRMP